jgi:hypothetical protein
MSAPRISSQQSVQASIVRELLSAERDPHRRQRELVRASLVACPGGKRPAPGGRRAA